jgi:hypothetical protein
VKPWRVQAITRSLPPHALVVTPARLLALRANRHVGLAGAQDRSQCRWFSKPANLLVLDEPTNDLDIETLELLEEILLDFEGTVLLVSHDRVFMDNVVTSLLVLDGRGGISEHVGGYSDWEARCGALPQAPGAPSAQSAAKPKRPAPPSISTQPLRKRKLSYKEQRELDRLPAEIESLEDRKLALEQTLSSPGFYQSSADEIQRVTQDFAAAAANLDAAYTRWDELEAERRSDCRQARSARAGPRPFDRGLDLLSGLKPRHFIENFRSQGCNLRDAFTL